MDFKRKSKPPNGIVARSLLDKGVLQPHSLAKYAAAFFNMSRSSVTRLSSSVLIIVLLPFCLRLAVALYPGIEAMRRNAEAGRYLRDRQLLFDHLIDRWDFEFFGVTRVSHVTS